MRKRSASRVMSPDLMDRLKNKLRAASYVHGHRDTKKLFNRYSSDGDGELDYAELTQCLVKLVAGITSEEVTQLFYDICTDGASVITAE